VAKRESRVLIVGAGEAGEMAVREMVSHPEAGFRPVGFIDDDPQKHGATVAGIPVLGGRERIREAVERLKADQILIAIPSASGNTVRNLVRYCDVPEVELRIVPGIWEIITGEVTIDQIRKVEPEDLLGRESVKLTKEKVGEYIRGRSVLVTGAGGSIGGELCRQVSPLGPSTMILVGRGENSIFEIMSDLDRVSGRTKLLPMIIDVGNGEAIRRTLKMHHPEIVFHCAAHKHVYLMELHPVEAVRNNVLATRDLIESSIEAGAERFVMLSTDKAVKPCSVMGASKRLAELYLQHRATESPATKLMAVRFGNVLGSRGSVVPLFQKQIRRGGPVTVSDPDVSRYFMTVREATTLVLQAAVLGEGGEVFVLDMGEPVRIMELAEELIALSGFRPGRDIKIEITGLKPGEKLVEEILDEHEILETTSIEKIRLARNQEGFARITKLIDVFERLVKEYDQVGIISALRETFPSFDAYRRAREGRAKR